MLSVCVSLRLLFHFSLSLYFLKPLYLGVYSHFMALFCLICALVFVQTTVQMFGVCVGWRCLHSSILRIHIFIRLMCSLCQQWLRQAYLCILIAFVWNTVSHRQHTHTHISFPWLFFHLLIILYMGDTYMLIRGGVTSRGGSVCLATHHYFAMLSVFARNHKSP